MYIKFNINFCTHLVNSYLIILEIKYLKCVYNENFWFQDILNFNEDSPHGVILFTFGSTIAMSSVPKNILTAFKKALAELPQRVLLKY